MMQAFRLSTPCCLSSASKAWYSMVPMPSPAHPFFTSMEVSAPIDRQGVDEKGMHRHTLKFLFLVRLSDKDSGIRYALCAGKNPWGKGAGIQM